MQTETQEKYTPPQVLVPADKQHLKSERAIGLLLSVKTVLELDIEFNKDGLLKLINEVLELIDDR